MRVAAEIVITAEAKIKGKLEDRIEVEINIGTIPGMTGEIQEEKEKGKFTKLYFLNFSKVIGKLMTVEIEGAKTTAATEETVEVDLPAEITGIKIQLVAVIATSMMTEVLFETKKVTPVITHAVAITILPITQNL